MRFLEAEMGRDRRIDTLRGMLLIIMTVDHLGGWLTVITGQSLGYVSAAEGFIFLSGFVCMEVYGRNLNDYRQAAVKTFARSVKIYKYHAFIIILMPLLSYLIPYYVDYWRNYLAPYYSEPLKTTLFGLVCLHKPMYTDILPMYAIFLALCPVVFFAMRKRKTHFLIFISFLLWAAGQYINPIASLIKFVDKQMNPGYFNVISWQFIFVLGMVASHWKKYLSALLKNKYLITLAFWGSLSFFVLRHSELPINFILSGERANYPAFRLINFVFLGSLVAIIMSYFKRSAYLPFVEYLGKNSLQVFSFQMVLIYLCMPFGYRISQNFGEFTHTIFVLLMVATLAIPVYCYNNYYKPLTKKAARPKLAVEVPE